MKLSKAEFEVSAHVCAGFETKEIAAKTFRSYHTVATHIKKIRLKNGFKNIQDLTREFVLEYGDPRQYIAMLLLIIQLGITYTNCSDEMRRTNNVRISRTKGRKN